MQIQSYYNSMAFKQLQNKTWRPNILDTHHIIILSDAFLCIDPKRTSMYLQGFYSLMLRL